MFARLAGLTRTTQTLGDELTYTFTGQFGDITSVGQSFTFHQNRTADDFAGMAYEVGASTVKWSIRLENIVEILRRPQRVTMRYLLDSSVFSSGAGTAAGFDTSWPPERRNHTPRYNVTTYYLTLNRPSGRAVARVEVFDLALVDGDTSAHLRPITHAVILRPAAGGVGAGFMLELAFPAFNDTLAYDPAIGMGTLFNRDDGKGAGSGDNSAMVIGVAVAIPLAIVGVVTVIVIGFVVSVRRRRVRVALERAVNFDSNCYVNSQVL